MQLMTLNIWGGYVKDKLLKFIEQYKDIDIFCLQEVYHNAPYKISTDDKELSLNIFSEIHALLPNHKGFFKPVVENIFGMGMFVKNNIEIFEDGALEIYNNPSYTGRGPEHHRSLQWVGCKVNNKEFYAVNVHGLWNGKGKTDSEDRLIQSHKIKNFMNSLNSPQILAGDLNLRPDTESLKIIAHGMQDLVKEYGITSTRSSLYTKAEKYADYIFTSKDLLINDFRVLPDEISDHLPLIAEFTV